MRMIFHQDDDELIEAYNNLLDRQKTVKDPEIFELITGKLIMVSQELKLRQYTQDEALNWYRTNGGSDESSGNEIL